MTNEPAPGVSKMRLVFEVARSPNLKPRQIMATWRELRRVGVERLSLERALAPGESPATSPDSSPGSTEGDLAAPLTQTTTSRESVKVLADMVGEAHSFSIHACALENSTNSLRR